MATTNEIPESFSAPNTPDDEIRDRIFRAVSHEVREVTGGKIARTSRELGRDIVEIVTEAIFTIAIREGYFRFPAGYGSLKVQRLRSHQVRKRLPGGEFMTLPENRVKMRYEEGAAVREQLGMPPHTNYQRRYERQPRLSQKTLDILAGTV